MHSCEVAVAPSPPIQGTALLLELGTLIIEGRSLQLKKGAPTPRTPERRCNIVTVYRKPTASFNGNQEGQNGSSRCGPSVDDVHSRVLAAKLLNVKNYQKSQFKQDLGEGEKAALPARPVSPPIEQHAGRFQQKLLQGQAEALWKEQVPFYIDVLLAPQCGVCMGPLMLLERWTLSIHCKGANPSNHITPQWLLNAVRSQLHFSQISAWSAKLHEDHTLVKEESPTERQRKLSRETCNFKKYESNCDEEELLKQEGGKKKKKLNFVYNIKMFREDCPLVKFKYEPVRHTFPITDIGSNVFLTVLLESLPRLDEIPTIQCVCSSNPFNILKRRRSKDLVNTSDEAHTLAHTLANVCSLSENGESSSRLQQKEGEASLSDDLKRKLKANALCSELGAINPDKGCSSGISRKFSVYSNPCSSDMLYSVPASRGSTPDNPEGKTFAIHNASAEESSEGREAKHGECSYQFINIQDGGKVPSDTVLECNFLLVDDRMQTPCGKKGKHKCYWDDESDNGSHLKDSNSHSPAMHQFNLSSTGSFPALDERRTREMAKYLRRMKKEAKVKQMRDNSECKSDETPSDIHRVKKSVRSRHNDLISMDSEKYIGKVCKGDADGEEEFLNQQNSRIRGPALEASYDSYLSHIDGTLTTRSQKSTNLKAGDIPPATSIPILQAARFDHAIRFGSYRSSVPFHGPITSKGYLSKELECACSSVGCDQMASVKMCKQSGSNQITDNNFNTSTQDLNDDSRCGTFTTFCNFCNSDDNYRPVVKKMISSCTQTDDFKCECGKALVPKCYECDSKAEKEESESYHSGMKRSWGSHNLASIDQSALLLEAIERPSRVSESQKEEADAGIDAIIYCDNDGQDVFDKDKCSNLKVIENKCDNNISDKSKLYNSCNNSDTSCLSACASNSEAVQHNTNDLTTDTHTSDAPHTSFAKFPFADNIDKAINFIRRPRLKRFMPIVDKVDQMVMERSEERKKYSLNTRLPNDEEFKSSGVSQHHLSIGLTTDNMKAGDSEKLVYEKGGYGNISVCHMDTKHGEKHPFEEKVRCFKHFRSDGETNLIDNKTVSCVDQNVEKDDLKSIKNSSFSIVLDHSTVPSVSEMDNFRCRLDSAASMVFHSRTGLPLTSSPAPLRRGKSSFDYDSSINSVSSIKSALYGVNITDLEPEPCHSSWSPGSSPGSPLQWEPLSPPLLVDSPIMSPVTVEKDTFSYLAVPFSNIGSTTSKSSSCKRSKFTHGTSSGLLGSFEESVLNGRLEPAATVAGFTAEIGASGSFCPQHLKLPVTVFFYSLGDNTTSAPYLGHINLGRRGYNVPKAGTIQVTLFNPHGTVVKMFVVMYDMADMPPNSKTFLRQKTLCVPAVCSEQPSKQDPRALRYLIHLRFLTSKSGKVYLHTDIRIIVSRKADMDTAHSLKPAMSLCYQQNSKSKSVVETGTFKRRSPKDLQKLPWAKDIDTEMGSRKITLKQLFPLSSFPNGEYNVVSTSQDDSSLFYKVNEEDKSSNFLKNIHSKKKDGRIRSRSDSMDGLPKELSYELRSYTYGPDNPKYSPR